MSHLGFQTLKTSHGCFGAHDSIKWEKIINYFQPPFEVIVVLRKNLSVGPTCIYCAFALRPPF
jgi:hypothetical protein